MVPSARVTLPLPGSCPTVTPSEPAGLSESLGAAIPIGVGPLPEATVSETGTVSGADRSMVTESPAEGALTLPAPSLSVALRTCTPGRQPARRHRPRAARADRSAAHRRRAVEQPHRVARLAGAGDRPALATLVRLSPATPLSEPGASASPDGAGGTSRTCVTPCPSSASANAVPGATPRRLSVSTTLPLTLSAPVA